MSEQGVSETTEVTVGKAFRDDLKWGRPFSFKGKMQVELKLIYPESCVDGKPPHIDVHYTGEDGSLKTQPIIPGDEFAYTHGAVLNGAVDNTSDGFFPLEIKHNGQTYYLKTTAKGGLILTK